MIAWSLPPIPLIEGSTTERVNAAATAASAALPPNSYIANPALLARGCAEATTLVLLISFASLQDIVQIAKTAKRRGWIRFVVYMFNCLELLKNKKSHPKVAFLVLRLIHHLFLLQLQVSPSLLQRSDQTYSYHMHWSYRNGNVDEA